MFNNLYISLILLITILVCIPTISSITDYKFNSVLSLKGYIRYTVPSICKEEATTLAAAIYHAAPYSHEDRSYLLAIASVESNFDRQAVGDNGDSIGAWQIQPRHWGYVDIHDPYQQAQKALIILKTYNYNLRKYNGGDVGWKVKQTKVYERKVKRELKRIRSYTI